MLGPLQKGHKIAEALKSQSIVGAGLEAPQKGPQEDPKAARPCIAFVCAAGVVDRGDEHDDDVGPSPTTTVRADGEDTGC